MRMHLACVHTTCSLTKLFLTLLRVLMQLFSVESIIDRSLVFLQGFLASEVADVTLQGEETEISVRGQDGW